MAIELNRIPGVITVGLFTDQKPDVCLVGDNNGVRKIFKEEIT
jgi:ribose 5-phosphate isomerase